MKLPLFKARVVEKLRFLKRAQLDKKLKDAGYNPFFLNSEDVSVDFLTDSGTGALSVEQRSAAEKGDESYAGSPSFRRMKDAITEVLGFPYVIPVHQGRGAERVVDFVFAKKLGRKKMIVPGNAPFDTTKANVEICLGEAIDCTISEAYEETSNHPFKGNVDLEKLEQALKKYCNRIPYVLLTITCNQVGGQPVSMDNITGAAKLARKYGTRFLLDGARYAENAHFIKERDKEYRNKSIRQIISEMMSHADGILVSAKKDCIVPAGGFIAIRDPKLFGEFCPYSVAFEGGLNYGGMTGRDMEALAVGLKECTARDYLKYRVGQVEYLGERLMDIGVPIIWPVGGHAVFVDAGKWLPRIPWQQFPGHGLACALFGKNGVRSVEIGTLLEGRDPRTGKNRRAKRELLRLAIPHRTYNREHFDYVVESFKRLSKNRNSICGVKLTEETYPMRHFTSRFKLV